MHKTLFLPGAGGSADFWKPVGALLPVAGPKHYFAWPGLGDQPHDPSIASLDDLVQLVLTEMDAPVDLVAQSMGGVIAAHIALQRPSLVRRLVLCVTSGGVDMAGLGASDWRADYRRSYPNAADWITAARAAPPLPVDKIGAPTLLIWGDSDPISPLTVGRHLDWRLPNARLEIVTGGGHDLAVIHADHVAGLIGRHLG